MKGLIYINNVEYICKEYIPHIFCLKNNCVRTQLFDLYQKNVFFYDIPLKKVVCVRKQSYLCIVKRTKRDL